MALLSPCQFALTGSFLASEHFQLVLSGYANLSYNFTNVNFCEVTLLFSREGIKHKTKPFLKDNFSLLVTKFSGHYIWLLIMRNIWIQGQVNEWWRNGRKGKKSMAKDWILTPQLLKNKQSLRQENVAVKGKSLINRFELWKWVHTRWVLLTIILTTGWEIHASERTRHTTNCWLPLCYWRVFTG